MDEYINSLIQVHDLGGYKETYTYGVMETPVAYKLRFESRKASQWKDCRRAVST